ncbi:gluconate 2-dehydrogenase subunit 3 family protein [Jannaschia formosa]|uniref:gluconate 2-dehydrogenase subunit 3 family protein n=1 Tax=Jannaschia formosa TaxID=2259592 RepID=UPI000E1B8A51|nr:gluconate 2-dehydrogenase subunit 3 family protein [Jannaschia formosa]TFL18368.1 gluconate 2-dehydrogenase subunit 3 family protein [Jannaschia formosa]
MTRYPGYDVLAKRDTPSWDEATRRVVDARLAGPAARPVLEERDYRTLAALCDAVVPQPDRAEPIPVAPVVEAAIAEDRTTGTRFEGLPTMREAWGRGLAALEAEARLRHGTAFADLTPETREALLHAVDAEEVEAPEWDGLAPRRLFRDVMADEILRVYFAHPAAWSEIGFGGPASPRGYVRLGAGRRDAWEAPFAPPPDGGER